MHNIWLIARREYLERIRAKSFLIMTVLIPLLFGGLFGGAALINGRGQSNTHLVVVAPDSQFGLDLQTELQSEKRGKMQVDVISPAGADTRHLLDNQLKQKEIDGYLWVTAATAGSKRPTFEWVPKSQADIVTKSTLASAVRTVLTREGLTHSGMGAADVDVLLQPVDLDSSQASKNDKALAAVGVAYGMFFLMYFVILFYGMNVARSIIEEKTSRVFEVLLATIKPSEMMAGKVIGVGSVGLTQVGIWLGVALLGLQTGIIARYMGTGVDFPLGPAQIIYFVLFFILGYVLYSSIAAALGAMTSSEQELQQLNMILMLPLITCSVIIFRVITDSDGMIARVFSFIPFCTPLIMYVRIAVHQPPWYEIAISIGEMLLTIAVVLWFASKIYRVGVLMYGKRPNLPELLRWLKYS